MPVTIQSSIIFESDTPADVMLQFEAAELPEQHLSDLSTLVTKGTDFVRIPAHDDIGERAWLHCNGQVQIDYSASVEVIRETDDLDDLYALPHNQMPGETVQYLLDSRYCHGQEFQSLVASEFAGTEGGARIAAILAWIGNQFEYAPGSSDPNTDATRSFIQRQGICRDFAHVLIAMARASAIPARYVACYAPGVTPQDFHAVAEVFLANPRIPGGGIWQMVDPTGMANPTETVKIGVGRDAADVSFLTSFAPIQFIGSNVEVSRND
ncbi:transglutaminase domain-containing protein [Erythrobacter sp. YT30]|uniref:transglutaminase domain-containing protein n=1 Tax=Erythrobacter sp. YT30 TaxID=1735012 RepID=UPI00076DDAE4|nr:transglutaminase domain-containing protein [Erythrobacter sp. YT30]KWV90991.1 transglutaminase [Erythrobacter sp. YT30]